MDGVLAIVLAGVFWGSVGVFARMLSSYQLSPFYIVVLRAAVAVFCLGMYMVFFRRDLLVIKREDRWRFFLSGFVSLVLAHPVLFLALEANPIAITTIFLYTSPFYAIFFARIIYAEPITVRKCTALALAVIGLLLVVNVFNLEGWAVTPTGLILGLVAGFLQGVQTLTMKNVSVRYPAVPAMFYSFGTGLIMLWPILLLSGVPMPLKLPLAAWLGVLGIGLINTLAGFLLFTYGLQRTEAGIASIASMLEPIPAGLFGYFILGEQLEFIQIIGMAVMMAGIVVAVLPAKGSAEEVAAEQEMMVL